MNATFHIKFLSSEYPFMSLFLLGWKGYAGFQLLKVNSIPKMQDETGERYKAIEAGL